MDRADLILFVGRRVEPPIEFADGLSWEFHGLA